MHGSGLRRAGWLGPSRRRPLGSALELPLALALTLCAILPWTGPARAATNTPVPAGQTFELRLGQSARVGHTPLRVGVVAVTEDSRCPHGAQCVRAGGVTVQAWWQQGRGPRHPLVLSLPPPATANHPAAGRDRTPEGPLRLLALSPEPVLGHAVAPSARVLTLRLDPPAPAATGGGVDSVEQ